jgi:hypothetical protein
MADRALLVAAVLVASSLAWWLLHRGDGRFRRPHASRSGGVVLDPRRLGASLGSAATFVLVSSSTCAQCPQARRVLAAVTAGRLGVRSVELPAEEHADVVRELGVLRTPTVLLLDRHGAVRARTSGPLRPDVVRAALADLLDAHRADADPAGAPTDARPADPRTRPT